MLGIVMIIIGVILALFMLLFIVYFLNLDMKLMVNVVAPFLEKMYDRRNRNQHL